MISKRLYGRAARGGGSIRVAADEAARQKAEFGADFVFDFSLGNPMGPVPDAVKKAFAEAAGKMDIDHGYTPSAGYEWVRRKIADSLYARFGTPYKPEHIVMTAGASGALSIAIASFVDEGDEVIVFPPFYPAYAEFAKSCGGVVVQAKVDPATFQPSAEALRSVITPKTKVVIINSPNNPSGAIYSQKTAEEMTAVLKEKEREYNKAIYLISDEPYRELVYTEEKLPVWANLYPNSVMAYSFSKSMTLAGERIGYAAISPTAADCALVVTAFRSAMGMLGFVNAPALAQTVVGKCVDEGPDVEYYAKSRNILYGCLTDLGFTLVKPEGAFYIFLKSPLERETDFLAAANKRHLIFVGGSGFGYPGYVRLSFCGDQENIKRSISAFELLARDCGLKK